MQTGVLPPRVSARIRAESADFWHNDGCARCATGRCGSDLNLVTLLVPRLRTPEPTWRNQWAPSAPRHFVLWAVESHLVVVARFIRLLIIVADAARGGTTGVVLAGANPVRFVGDSSTLHGQRFGAHRARSDKLA